jgi:hypothetical protein
MLMMLACSDETNLKILPYSLEVRCVSLNPPLMLP